jgi:hypothetical protein
MSKALIALAGALLTLAVTASVLAYQRVTGGGAAATTTEVTAGSGVIVVDWNKELVRIVSTPGAQPATVHPARSFAIMHAAIYDAVVSITHRGTPYLLLLNAPTGVRPDAAAAEPGHDTLVALYPSMKGALDQQLASELATIPDATAKRQGVEVGRLAATLMLAARANDGSSVTPPPLPPPAEPGDYRPTPPTFSPAVFTQWANVTPLCCNSPTSSGQRRPQRSRAPDTLRP